MIHCPLKWLLISSANRGGLILIRCSLFMCAPTINVETAAELKVSGELWYFIVFTGKMASNCLISPLWPALFRLYRHLLRQLQAALFMNQWTLAVAHFHCWPLTPPCCRRVRRGERERVNVKQSGAWRARDPSLQTGNQTHHISGPLIVGSSNDSLSLGWGWQMSN